MICVDKATIVKRLEKHIKVSSWLLWGDQFQYDENAKKYVFKEDDINTKYVFVALNASFESHEEWGSFHSGKRGDMNIYSAFEGTEYEGSYITDLLKYRNGEIFTKGDSSSVISCIIDDPKMFNENIKMLAKELDLFPDNTMVLAFGDDVYKFLISNRLINIRYKNRIFKLPHFSARYYNNTNEKRSYVLAVGNALESIKRPGEMPYKSVLKKYKPKTR